MNENEVRQRIVKYLLELQDSTHHQLPDGWLHAMKDTHLVLCHQPNGDWLASIPGHTNEGIFLKVDGTIFPYFGALGKMIPRHGWLPASREYFLGSAGLGRYQLYEQGLAVWEYLEGVGDLGYPVATWSSLDSRAQSCSALIAFFDLRGFTNWSASQVSKKVQDTIESFEHAFQNAFSRPSFQQLFAKGTGDGLMVVSKAGCYSPGQSVGDRKFQSGHVKAFCIACAETVEDAAKHIPDELAVGCGITQGEITQLYLLGRLDYIGPSVNEASKIQTIAYGELCLSENVRSLLKMDGMEVGGKNIPGKGIRIDAKSLVYPTGA